MVSTILRQKVGDASAVQRKEARAKISLQECREPVVAGAYADGGKAEVSVALPAVSCSFCLSAPMRV